MKLIGINGRKQSGKDTLFKILRDNNPQVNFLRTSFADKLKLSGMAALGYKFSEDEIDEAVRQADILKDRCHIAVLDSNGHVFKRISGREWWQYYGTEAHRDLFGYDFWVDQVFPTQHGLWSSLSDDKWLEQLFPGVDVVVETTARFENEAQRILDLGGEIWHIDADVRLGPLPPEAHVSEHGLPPEYVTLTIPNNGSLEQFTHGVKAAWALSTGGVTRC